MQLDELRKSMSTLEQVLAKTNTDIKINLSVAQTAQTKLLNKFRQEFTVLLILAVIFAAAAIGNVNPLSFPLYLKIYLSSLLAVGAIWYIYLYRKLKGINIATLAPSQLFSGTANIKLLTLSGEIFFGAGFVVLFTLLFPNAWHYNRVAFWAMAVALLIVIIYSIVHYYPKYIKLFRDLNSIKE